MAADKIRCDERLAQSKVHRKNNALAKISVHRPDFRAKHFA
jgi:hypothetical protein